MNFSFPLIVWKDKTWRFIFYANWTSANQWIMAWNCSKLACLATDWEIHVFPFAPSFLNNITLQYYFLVHQTIIVSLITIIKDVTNHMIQFDLICHQILTTQWQEIYGNHKGEFIFSILIYSPSVVRYAWHWAMDGDYFSYPSCEKYK